MVAGAALRHLRFANCSVALQHSFSLIRNVFQKLTVSYISYKNNAYLKLRCFDLTFSVLLTSNKIKLLRSLQNEVNF